MPFLTEAEQIALIEAMKQSYGPCTCRPVNGAMMRCDGHRFLAETQLFGGVLTDRVQILAYYRRFASFWTGPEFSRPFVSLEPEPMLEPEPLPSMLEAPREQPDPNRLPW